LNSTDAADTPARRAGRAGDSFLSLSARVSIQVFPPGPSWW
jgi:hypothetical protein